MTVHDPASPDRIAQTDPAGPAGPGPAAATDATAVALDHEAVPPEQVRAGTPTVAAQDLAGPPGLCVGIWEHSAGVSADVEVDEVFVVLSGRATVEVEGGPRLELSAGTVGVLPAGARTTWTVHEPLRKVWVTTA